MPDSPEALRFQRVRAVFGEASEVEGDARREVLERECAGDATLRAEVESMLAALDEPAFLNLGGARELIESPPESIGDYRVRGVLGRGGFGIVYHAEQTTPVEREVALKVLDDRPLDERAVHRFEAECQSLARVEHPQVARLYDAGRTETGRHYLAMELVRGEPITTFCDRRRLGVRERVELLLRVCAAIEHAHQRAVVHRDLKPSNVLVEEVAGRAAPKVIDFGIAKLTTDDTVTGTGLALGTPAYMSPEQAAGEPVDTRSDVYALGVLSYELLSGQQPFARTTTSSNSPLATLRRLREEDPCDMAAALLADPSTKAEIAARRGCAPTALARELRGDLKWVVGRAMARRPDERYASVSGLIADLERYLTDLPVSARKSAALYVVRKFVRRHRVAVGVALFVSVLVVSSITGLWVVLDLAREARDDALGERARALLNEYAAHLSAARAALQTGDVGEARRHLTAAAPRHRGWEWRYLAAQCDRSLECFELGDQSFDTAWLDDRRVIVRVFPNALVVLDTETGEVERRLEFEAEVAGFELHRETGRLAVRFIDTVRLWDTKTWVEPRILLERERPEEPGRIGQVRQMAFSSDGRKLYTSENGGVVRAFDLDDAGGRVLLRLNDVGFDENDAVLGLAVLPGDRQLALSLTEGHVLLVDPTTGAVKQLVDFDDTEGITCLIASAEGDLLYAGVGNDVVAWDLARGRPVGRRALGVAVSRLALSPNGETLFAGGGWRSERLTSWDARTLELVTRFHGHRLGIGGFDVSPDGTRLASASRDGTLRVWADRVAGGFEMLYGGWSVTALDVSPDGATIAASDNRGSVRFWDAQRLEETRHVEVGERLLALALGNSVAYAGGRSLWVIDHETGEARVACELSERPSRFRLDDAERWLFSHTRDEVQLWSLPDPSSPRSVALPRVSSVDYDADRAAFVVGTEEGLVFLLDPTDGDLRVVRTGSAPVLHLSASGPDLVTVSDDVELFRGGEVARSFALASEPSSVLWSSRNERLAMGYFDCTLRLWNEDGVQLLSLDEAPKPLYDLRLAAGGRTIVAMCTFSGAQSYLVAWSAPGEVVLGD